MSSRVLRAKRRKYAMRGAVHALLERLEERRLMAGDVRLVGITGYDHADTDHTLYDITVTAPGAIDQSFLDGWDDITNIAPDTFLTISTTTGVSQGRGALRVDVDQAQFPYWGIRSPNIISLLAAGVTRLSYDMTLRNVELNGGSYGGGTDNSFNGYAQSNELAVQISTQSNGFIQRDFFTAHGTDSLGTSATWSGVDGTRHITWDLTTFTSEGLSLKDFVAAHGPNDAHFWLPTQGQDTNGHTGPMRFYFDNFQVQGAFGTRSIGDFELLNATRIGTLPFVPDNNAIAFDPQNAVLMRTSGAASSHNDPTRIGYRDSQFMEQFDPNNFDGSQVGIFNANFEGGPVTDPPDGTTANYGLPAPFPSFVSPDHRRTDDETDPAFNVLGANEYHSLRDLTFSTTDQLFYATDESGIYKLTRDGVSTFLANPAGVAGGPAGITYYTSQGARWLGITERDGANLWIVDPATGQTVTSVMLVNEVGAPWPGVLSIVEDPTSNTLLGIAKSIADPNNPLARELVRIDPVSGLATSLGVFSVPMADLAFIVTPPSVTSSQFVYENAPQRLVFKFTQNLGDSITKDDLTVEKLGPGGGPVPFADPVYDIYNNTVTFQFNQVLPDGNYRAVLSAAGVTNTLGMPITANEEVPFFWLTGDLNRDRSVSISDFIDLASRFNQPASKWSEGDLNYDGQITISDFIDLAANFNKTLDPPQAAAAPASEMLSVRSDTAVTDGDQGASLFKRSSSRRHAHHRRHAARPVRHWIGRGGAY